MDMRMKKRFSFHSFFGYYSDVERQKKLAEHVKNNQPYYFAIAMPTDYVTYEDMDKPLKHRTQPCYMNFTVFKIVSVTPAKVHKKMFSNNEIVVDELPSMVFETMDGKRINAFQQCETESYGKKQKILIFSEAVFREINKNFVHPRLNIDNFNVYSAYEGEYGEKEQVYFKKVYYVKEEYGRWKETIEKQRKYFDDHFARKDEEREMRRSQRRRHKREAEEAKRRYTDTFDKDFGVHKSQPEDKVFYCPSCGTGCKVPKRGKKIEITCPNPNCNTKFIVLA